MPRPQIAWGYGTDMDKDNMTDPNTEAEARFDRAASAYIKAVSEGRVVSRGAIAHLHNCTRALQADLARRAA